MPKARVKSTNPEAPAESDLQAPHVLVSASGRAAKPLGAAAGHPPILSSRSGKATLDSQPWLDVSSELGSPYSPVRSQFYLFPHLPFK